MTAGRVFWISPPSDGLKSTHQTSPRSMGFCEGRVSDQAFGPLQRLLFARMVGGHIPVGSFDVLRHDMGTREFFNELADATPADGPVKALIDGLADSDCEPVPGPICSSWITSGWAARSSSTSCFVSAASMSCWPAASSTP